MVGRSRSEKTFSNGAYADQAAWSQSSEPAAGPWSLVPFAHSRGQADKPWSMQWKRMPRHSRRELISLRSRIVDKELIFISGYRNAKSSNGEIPSRSCMVTCAQSTSRSRRIYWCLSSWGVLGITS